MEARLLLELGAGGRPTAAELAAKLGRGEAYLSRILGKLGEADLVGKSRDPGDGRRWPLALSASGKKALAALDRASDGAAATRLVGAMEEIRLILEEKGPEQDYSLDAPRPGDLGWIVQRHGEIYASEHGFDSSFEALVARIVADLAGRERRAGERIWIARAGAERLGSVAIVREDEDTARLRLLLVEPQARGRGLGAALVGESVGFARRSG